MNSGIYIAGDGSLARVIHDLVPSINFTGFIGLESGTLLGKPIIPIELAADMFIDVILGVLYPVHRKEFVDKIGSKKFISLTLGTGLTRLYGGIVALPGSYVMNNAIINDFAHVHTGAIVGHDCIIGKYSFIGPGVILGGGATIGEFCRIGMGARVLPRVIMEPGSCAAAGAVVTKDVPAGVTVGGIPARKIEHKNRERF